MRHPKLYGLAPQPPKNLGLSMDQSAFPSRTKTSEQGRRRLLGGHGRLYGHCSPWPTHGPCLHDSPCPFGRVTHSPQQLVPAGQQGRGPPPPPPPPPPSREHQAQAGFKATALANAHWSFPKHGKIMKDAAKASHAAPSAVSFPQVMRSAGEITPLLSPRDTLLVLDPY
jgi:hypothetical protein